MVKNLSAMQETQVWTLGPEDPLEEEMAAHSSIPAWEIPWTEEPGGLQSMGSQKSWTQLSNSATICLYQASLVAQTVKNLPAMQDTRVRSLGWEDPLEKRTGIHSSIFVWRIPRIEEPGGLQSMGSKQVGHHWVTNTHTQLTDTCIMYFTNITSIAVSRTWHIFPGTCKL